MRYAYMVTATTQGPHGPKHHARIVETLGEALLHRNVGGWTGPAYRLPLAYYREAGLWDRPTFAVVGAPVNLAKARAHSKALPRETKGGRLPA